MTASGFWVGFTNGQFDTCLAFYFVQVTQCDTQNKKSPKPRCIKRVLALEYHWKKEIKKNCWNLFMQATLYLRNDNLKNILLKLCYCALTSNLRQLMPVWQDYMNAF